MTKITLNNVTTFTNDNTAVTTVNGNSSTVVTAFDNTLSRDGTSPNQMGAPLDMNSNRILNLPTPVGANDPVRLTDLAAVSSGTFTPLPSGGTTGQPLAKNSNTNYDTGWASITGSGNFVKSTSPTITSPTLVTPAIGTPASGVLTNATGLPISTGVSGLGTNVATFLGTPTSANLRAVITDETGTGAAVFATSPTMVTPILGQPTSVDLTNATNVPVNQAIGNLSVNRLNSGTGATATSYWRGDGTWNTPAVTFLETLNGSTSSSISTTVSWSGYNHIMIIVDNLTMSASGNILMQVNAGGVQTATYVSGASIISTSGVSAWGTGTTATNGLQLNSTSSPIANADGLSGTYYLYNITNAAQKKLFTGTGTVFGSGVASFNVCYGTWNGGNAAVTGATFITNTGTFNGPIKLYGML